MIGVADGQFGAMMQVALVNDGPVTVVVDSAEGGPSKGKAVAAGGATAVEDESGANP